MKTYAVSIERKTTTVIHIEAASAAHARRKAERYGLIEASNDYEPQSETLEVRIACIKEAQT